jgi:hypothetical protein
MVIRADFYGKGRKRRNEIGEPHSPALDSFSSSVGLCPDYPCIRLSAPTLL